MNNTATKFNVTFVFSSFMYGIAYFLCKPPTINTGSSLLATLANIVLILLSVIGIIIVIAFEDFLIDLFAQMGNLVAFSVLFVLYAFSACAIIGTINDIIGDSLSLTYRICFLLIYGISTFFAACSLTEDSRDNEYSVLIVSSLLHILTLWGIYTALVDEQMFQNVGIDSLGGIFLGWTVVLICEFALLIKYNLSGT